MARLGRGYGFSKRFGVVASRAQLDVTIDAALVSAQLVAPTLRITLPVHWPLSDNFNRASLGSDWVTAWANSDPGVISSNAYTSGSAGNEGAYYSPAGAFQNGEIIFTVADMPDSTAAFDVKFRANAEAGGAPVGSYNAYALSILAVDGSWWLHRFQWDGFVVTTLADGAAGSAQAGDIFRIVLVDDNIKVYRTRGGTETPVADVTDTVYRTGYVGAEFSDTTGALDDWQVIRYPSTDEINTVAMPDVGITVQGAALDLTWDTATAAVDMVAPTLRLDYTTPAATSSAMVMVLPTLRLDYVVPAATSSIDSSAALSYVWTWEAATASADMVAPVLRISYTTPAATASVEGGSMDITRPVPAATATVELILPTLRIDYAVPAATSSSDGVAPGLAITIGVPAGEVDGEGVAPNTVFTLAVAADSTTAELVLPVLRITYGASAATSTVEMPDVGFAEVETLTLTWDAAEADVDAVAPILSHTFAVDEATSTVECNDVTLQILSIVTLVVDTATASVDAVAPALSLTYGVPAGSVTGDGITPTASFTYGVPASTASVSMPDVGYTEVETLALVWDAAEADAIVVPPSLSDTYSVPAATATCEAVSPTLSLTLAVETAEISGISVPPTLAFVFGVPSAEASVVGGNVALASEGEFVVFAAEVSAVLVPPVLSITLSTSAATANVEMPDVGYAELGELNLTWEAAEATASMADVGLTITPYVPPTPTPGASGGTLLEFVFNDLDLEVKPATAFVTMVPPTLRAYREVKVKKFLRRTRVVEEPITVVPAPMPVLAFTIEPENHFFFKVKTAEGLSLGVEYAHYLDEGLTSNLWGKYRRRTPEEEAYELALLGFTL